MAAPTIKKGEEHFFNITYEGNGGGQRVGKFIPFTDQATIANSCIFNDADNAYVSKTFGTPTNNKKWTLSAWVKLGVLGTNRALISSNINGAEYFDLFFTTGNVLKAQNRISSSNDLLSSTSRTFEDTSKFYHFLIVYDSDNSTSADRYIVYVDGDRLTVDDEAGSGIASAFNKSGVQHQVGISNTLGSSGVAGLGYQFDGYMAEVNFVDGQALLPASFGITDTSTGRWIPKTVEPFPTTTTSIAVTVVSSGGNKYALDGVTQGTVTLIEGATYKFDQSDSSNSGHPLRFSTTSNGTHGGGSEYTTGVTTVGTPGSSGAYTQITVAVGAPTLYYYCSSHSGMGGTANTQDQYGTNGFRLAFAQSNDLGDDTSGNGNDFNETNLTTSDQTTDSPTQNFATLTPNRMKSGFTLSEGNLKMVSNTTDGLCMSGMRVSGGKFYIETEVDAFTNGGSQGIGFCEETLSTSTDPSGTADVFGIFSNQTDFVVLRDGAYVQDSGGALAAGNIVQIAFDGSDLGNAKFYLGINNSKWYYEDMSENSSFDATRPTLTLDLRARTNLRFYVGNRASTGSPGSSTYICNFGQKSYSYTAPTGFGSFNQDALPETGKGIPGFVWAKSRDNTESHTMYDSSRGRQLQLSSNNTTAQNTQTDGLQKFLKGGYQCEDHERINQSGISYVGWNWVANTGTTASNTDGATSSTVQANTTAGFSIVEYTGTGGATSVGHGLSAAPEWMLFKDKGNSTNWRVYHTSMGGITKYMLLNSSAAVATASMWGSPTASAFIVGGTGYEVNESGNNYIAYCWHGVDGFSKFGGYTGNGNANGPYVFTGFKPAYFMSKRIDSTSDWIIWDNARSKFNPCTERLIASSNGTEGSAAIDLLSNGIKIRNSDVSRNASGGTYIYMAFAERPFVGDGTNPVTAR
jgi:hypothetical protein